MKTVYFDFETYSDVEISLGARAYVNGKDFRAVLLAYAVDSGPVRVTSDFFRIPEEIRKLKGPVTFCAHNAPFDKYVWEKTFGELPPGSAVRDTAALCRYLSVPASLDNAGAFFGIGSKKAEGKTLLKKMVKQRGHLDPADLRGLMAYAKQDVVLLRKLDKVLSAVAVDVFSQAVHGLHLDMNRGGIAVDRKRASFLHEAVVWEKALQAEAARKKFGTYGTKEQLVAASAAQVKKFLAARGVHTASVAEKELEDFLSFTETELPKPCAELISFYREIQSRGGDKVEKIVSNDLARIYDASLYHGAHTGRPTGGGINLFNVKRYTDGDDALPFEKSIARILKEAPRGERIKRLSSLLWGVLVPEKGRVLFRSDLSAIEPRVGAWLRNDQKTLEIYRAADAGTGKDEYTIFGESMNFPKAISRNLSKIVILAACYGMGPERLRYQCRAAGVPDPGEEKAGQILDAYHRRNPSVKRAWFDLVKTAVLVISDGTVIEKHGLKFNRARIGKKLFLRVELPSGRVKSYADVRIETAGDKGWKTFSYIDPVRGFRQTMRPAMLYENMVQAAAADVLFEKAFRAAELSEIKLNIYDELNASVLKRDVPKLKKIMTAPCSFLPGMPVNAKTVVCSSFHKGDILGGNA